MSTITLLSGVPGSGKSYWAKNNKTPNTIIVNRDAIREMIHGSYKVGDKESFITDMVYHTISHAIYKKFDVIVDETLVKRSGREKFIKDVKRNAENFTGEKINFRCVQFKPLSYNIMIDNRMLSPKGQSRRIWGSVILNMIEKFERAEISEGFDDIIEIMVKDYALESLKMIFRQVNHSELEDIKECATCESASGECNYKSCEKE